MRHFLQTRKSKKRKNTPQELGPHSPGSSIALGCLAKFFQFLRPYLAVGVWSQSTCTTSCRNQTIWLFLLSVASSHQESETFLFDTASMRDSDGLSQMGFHS